jgi:protein O-mannosyl-transferase
MEKNKKCYIKTLQSKTNNLLPLWLWLVGIILLTVIAYLPAFNNGFTNWDDTLYVTDSKFITSISVQSILAFFKTLQAQGNYHPLTLISLALDYKLFGFNPAGYHTVNILFHLFNICLVFLLIQKLFKTEFITIATTLLFAIHPMHVESVAWVSERKDVLYVFFYLAGLWCYVKYIDEEKRNFIIYTVLCFVLSLLAKGQAVTFPLALMIIDYIRNGKLSIKSVLVKAPFLILSLLAGVVAIYAQREDNATQLYIHLSLSDRIVVSGYAFALYIFKLFVPIKLAAVYPYTDKINGVFNYLVYLSFIIPVGFAVLMWKLRKNRVVLSGLLFFLLNIMLLLQLMPVGYSIISERYTYLSYLGLFWAASYGIHYIIQKAANTRLIITTVCCIYVIVLTFFCFQRTKVWHDSSTLWENELSQFTNVPVAWNSVGMIYESKDDPRNAKECFNHAISVYPDYALALADRSLAYIQLGLYDSAILDDNRALKILPNDESAHQNRSAAYALAGKSDSSLMDCDWLLARYPNARPVHLNHGLACIAAQKYDSALFEFNWIISQDPDNEVAYAQRGVANTMLNKPDDAINDYNKALELKKDDWQVYGYMAHTYLLIGNNEKAIENATISINNSHGPINNDLITRAQAYYNIGRYTESLQDYLQLQKMGYTIPPAILAELTKKVNGK